MKQVLLVATALLFSASPASAERIGDLDSQFALLEAAIAGEAVADPDPHERCLYYTHKVATFCNPGPKYNATICKQYEVLMEEWCKKADEAIAQWTGQ